MALDLQQERQQAHALLGLLPAEKLGAVRNLLEVMLDANDDEEELTEEDRRALRASDERLRNGGQTIPLEQLVEELGFTMEQVRSGTLPPG
jgi:predicted xylose isomerase-like sugar epimerase